LGLLIIVAAQGGDRGFGPVHPGRTNPR